MKANTVKRKLIVAGQIILCVMIIFLTAFFGQEFFTRNGLIYNEMGRYFDEDSAVVYHEQAVPVYGFLFGVFMLLLIFVVRWLIKERTDGNLKK